MEAYATALSYAIPGFVILIIIEALAARLMKKDINNSEDVISSLSSGMTNTLKSLLGLSIVIVSYEWMHNLFAIMDIQSSLTLYILAFIGIDFAAYWSHRFNHVINVFWNRHIVHHSSEEFNLSCALRQEISAIVGVYFFLYIPLAIIGIPPKVIAITAPLHLFAQFWYHTRLINRMGVLEYILVTPSHHRVHHAINDIYIDKNYAAIFIVWDRMFGTFQEELPEEEPIYGTLKPARTWNPVVINYMHMWQLIKDAWHAQSIWDKVRIWFMPTGWRPADVIKRHPVKEIPVYERIKYQTDISKGLLWWSWFQFILTNLLLYHMLVQFGSLDASQLVLYASFLFLSIFGFTSLMDVHMIGLVFESIKSLFGLFIIWYSGGWFGLDAQLPMATSLMSGYLLTAGFLAIYFIMYDRSSKSFSDKEYMHEANSLV
ncbi:MAG: sterol desaturase family protein [Saprospiraceae bacterium]|nr:sterol desaturase family protein [Bacteroidia bacterium]NNF21389.1 sterol desaturase family protein [Saprospiraceae bacterium]